MNPSTKIYTFDDFKVVIEELRKGKYGDGKDVQHNQRYFESETSCGTTRCISGIAQSIFEPDTKIEHAVTLKKGAKETALNYLFYMENFDTELVIRFFDAIQDDGSIIIKDCVFESAMIKCTEFYNVVFVNCTFTHEAGLHNDYPLYRNCEFRNCTFNEHGYSTITGMSINCKFIDCNITNFYNMEES